VVGCVRFIRYIYIKSAFEMKLTVWVQVSQTLRREFSEEARHLQGYTKDDVTCRLEAMFASGGVPVFAGYVFCIFSWEEFLF
jgi:hypothetical protein